MDVDRYVAENRASWERLQQLATRAARSPRRLAPGESEELVGLYRSTSSQLSHVRGHFGDPALTHRLTQLVALANGAIYGGRDRAGRTVARFFSETFPAAVWHDRRFVTAAAALFAIPAVAVGTWIAASERALDAGWPDGVRQAYLETDFEAYYSSEPAAQFATEVFINNVQVAILAFATGILLCVVTGFILAYNGAHLGLAAGLFHYSGRGEAFWGLILPHGLLELSAIVIAGGAGMALGWSIIAPGDRSRTAALADEGRRSVVIVTGLILAFGTAGAIEGFVTGTALPTVVRVGIGVLAFGAFALWILAYGPPAAARGLTGALGERPATDDAQIPPVALSSR